MTSASQQTTLRVFLLPLALEDSSTPIFCLFSQNQVVEILGKRLVQRIPLSPAYLKGVIRYRQQLLPVIDLENLCNSSQYNRKATFRQLVVIRTGTIDPVTGKALKVAIATSSGLRSIKISSRVLATAFVEQDAPLSLQQSGIIRGFFQREGTQIAIVDLSTLLLGVMQTEVEEALELDD